MIIIIIILLYLVCAYLLYTSREGIRLRVGRKKRKKKRRRKKTKRRKKKMRRKKTKRRKKSKKISVCKGKCCKYNDANRYSDLDCGQLNKFCGQKLIDGCIGTGDIDCFERLRELKC